MLILALVAKV